MLSGCRGVHSPWKKGGGILAKGSACRHLRREAKAAALNQTSSPLKKKKNCTAMGAGSPATSGPGTQLRTRKKLPKDPLSPNKDFWKTKCQQLIHQKQRSNAELLGQRERLDWCVREIERLKKEAMDAKKEETKEEGDRGQREDDDAPRNALRKEPKDAKRRLDQLNEKE